MSLKPKQELLIKLTKDKDLLNSKLETQLLEQSEQAKAELNELQAKKEEREKTIELFELLLGVEDQVEAESFSFEMKEKRRRADYARERIPFIQNQISNYDPKNVKDKDSIMYSSYVLGHSYFVSKLAELTADLEI